MSALVEVGRIVKKFEVSALDAYIAVDVTIDGERVVVATMIGVREYEKDTCRKVGGDVRPFLRAWWCDRSDWQDVSPEHVEAVEEEIAHEAACLWREARS